MRSWVGLTLVMMSARLWANGEPGADTIPVTDSRNIRAGLVIPDEGYCDQPYVVVTKEGHWLCTLTTGRGVEGQSGQHVVATISSNQGRSWGPLIDIETADGPEASWAVPLVTDSGRIYVFYTFNGDRISSLKGKRIRADMLGWYVYRYSDDGGRTWSGERYRLPMRMTACDRGNDWSGEVQIFWGICKPQAAGQNVLFTFTKLGRYMLENGEGWVMRSDNVLTEKDPDKIRWELLPQGERGIRRDDFGSVQEEHNIVWLGGEQWLCIYRTTRGFPCQSTSMDGGRSWSLPEPMTYSPGGERIFKNPRACPKIWRVSEDRYLFWFHHHGGTTFEGRNPAWISGGILREGAIHWSQPEILLYDPDPKVRMSYPDLIAQENRVWVTETQKDVARVHEVPRDLLEGLWSQGRDKRVQREGLIAEFDGASWSPRTPDVDSRSTGMTMEAWVTPSVENRETVLFRKGRDGRGVTLLLTTRGTALCRLSDGKTDFTWESDPGSVAPGKRHHIALIVEPGPRLVLFVIDGQLNDGGKERPAGWGRWPEKLHCDIDPAIQTILPENINVHRSRIYHRPLRVSEAVAHFHAGP